MISFLAFAVLSTRIVNSVDSIPAPEPVALPASSKDACGLTVNFVMETSELVGFRGFTWTLSAISNLSEVVLNGAPSLPIGLAHFSSPRTGPFAYKSAIAFNVSKYTAEEITKMTQEMKWGFYGVTGISDLEVGLKLANELSANTSPKPGKQITVLFAQGFHDAGGDPIPVAKTLKNNFGSTIYAIAMPPRTNITVLEAISGSAANVFSQKNFSSIAYKIISGAKNC